VRLDLACSFIALSPRRLHPSRVAWARTAARSRDQHYDGDRDHNPNDGGHAKQRSRFQLFGRLNPRRRFQKTAGTFGNRVAAFNFLGDLSDGVVSEKRQARLETALPLSTFWAI
jgi:hypothetical protein